MIDCLNVAPDVWRRAITRADAFHLSVRRIDSGFAEGAASHWFRVASASRPGKEHGVHLEAARRGAIALRAGCSCDAGQRERACMHIAAVLVDQGLDGLVVPPACQVVGA